MSDADRAANAVKVHAREVIARRQLLGLPTCGDRVSDVRKLSALGEEYGEVCRAIQDGLPVEQLRRELLDVATAAALWAESLSYLSLAGGRSQGEGCPYCAPDEKCATCLSRER